MKLEADAVIPFPRAEVWKAYRERMAEIPRYLPNVRRIEVKSRRDVGGNVEFVNEWYGGGEIPEVARSFVDEALLRWTDHATWKAAEWCCHWRMEPHAFRDVIRAQGVNRFLDLGGATRLEIRGDVEIDPSRLPMVPRLVAPRLARTFEALIVGRVRPNLLTVANGVSELLKDSP